MTESEDGGEAPLRYCSFCEKDETAVRKLISGRSAFICDACADLCREAVAPSVSDDEIQKSLVRVWAELTRRQQWTAAMLAGVLARMVDDAKPEPRTWSGGEMLTGFVLNQLHPTKPRAPHRLKCDYCSKSTEETSSMHAGHSGQICGECVEQMLTTRAWWSPAYRAQLIERLAALADQPPPPPGLSS